MENENLIFVKFDKIKLEHTYLYFLGFLKFIALIVIIRVHLLTHEKELFYAIRACEFLFVSSGFLVGYNYVYKDIPNTFIYSFKYYYKHLRTCYPLYFLNFIFGAIRNKEKIKFDLSTIEIILINIFMLQVWSRHRKLVAFYNGISWFLHDLLICYLLSPFLLNGINSIKKSLIIFFVTSLIRILVEEFLKHGAFNILDIHLHDGPFVRIFEFYLGMLIIPSFLKLRLLFEKKKKKIEFKILFTSIPILLTIIIYYIFISYQNLLRCYFVLIFCIYIFIIGYEYGYLHDILSNKLIRLIINPQMEMYLSHVSINKIIEDSSVMQYLLKYLDKEILFIIKLIIIFSFGFFYKKLLKEKLANFLDKILIIINRIVN